jgi:N-hydroxyarylamine O-acetyltransferase
VHEIDLEAYFARIGYSGSGSPTLETLRHLAVLHPTSIAFENLDPLMKRPVRLDLPSLEQKLVNELRGGYCYEHNTLFEAVLRQLGFLVSSHAARVQWNASDGQVRARTHMVLRVDLPEGPHIADTGFGLLTLTAPLRLQADVVESRP